MTLCVSLCQLVPTFFGHLEGEIYSANLGWGQTDPHPQEQTSNSWAWLLYTGILSVQWSSAWIEPILPTPKPKCNHWYPSLRSSTYIKWLFIAALRKSVSDWHTPHHTWQYAGAVTVALLRCSSVIWDAWFNIKSINNPGIHLLYKDILLLKIVICTHLDIFRI